MTKFRSEVLSTEAEIATIAPEWERLRLCEAEPHLAHRPEYLALEARTGGGSGHVNASRLGTGIMVVTLEERERLIGLAPLLVHVHPWCCRLGYAEIAEFPMRRAILCGGAFLGAQGPAEQEALFRAIAASAVPYQMIYVEALSTQSPLFRFLDESPAVRESFWVERTGVAPHRVLEVRGTFEAYLEKFSGRTRRTLRYKVRHLEAALTNGARVERVTSASQIAGFAAQAEQVSKRGWKGRRIGLVTRAEAHVRRFEEYAESGWLRCYVLLDGDAPVAYVVGIQGDGVFHYDHAAYDPAFAAHHPGTGLLYRIIEDLHAHDPPRLLDFGQGDNEYKRIFSTRAYDDQSVLLLRKTPYNALALAAHRTCSLATAAVRSGLERFHMKGRVRQALRGTAA